MQNDWIDRPNVKYRIATNAPDHGDGSRTFVQIYFEDHLAIVTAFSPQFPSMISCELKGDIEVYTFISALEEVAKTLKEKISKNKT